MKVHRAPALLLDLSDRLLTLLLLQQPPRRGSHYRLERLVLTLTQRTGQPETSDFSQHVLLYDPVSFFPPLLRSYTDPL